MMSQTYSPCPYNWFKGKIEHLGFWITEPSYHFAGAGKPIEGWMNETGTGRKRYKGIAWKH